MMHDDKVTVPPLTKTPPPCKQRAKRESPMGGWENFRLCGKYILDFERECAHNKLNSH
ncbi:hypothetical protein Ctob_015543 [Chrysochromulina tobinii]|uniref:Uncharacterized protein n=1 Tax=Chrysochromulina tobinii TaxID=1460289 RepID=A0A0M0K763_9EUKA|nr:hypothetical protein Ctob_015543 [Chrysochromulina tobinii]|eukprot:KOO34650.1 hypothetical protein Ctob_015543 [Chrysochromulina sp. CCMP291]